MSLDEAAEAVLRGRWSRSQRYITIFSVLLPALQLLLCTVIVIWDSGMTWPAAIPLLPAALAAVAPRQWLRRQTPLDPLTWLPAACLGAGVQLLASAIPAYGLATSIAPDEQVAPVVLFSLCLVVAAATGLTAHRAARALLVPLVAELGSADLRLAFPVRAATAGPELVSAQIFVERDRLEWMVRLHTGSGGAPRKHLSVEFHDLLQVMPVTLPLVPEARPWTTLPGGVTLYAEAGPAILLTAAQEHWLIPVHNADLIAEVINRRRVLWLQGNG